MPTTPATQPQTKRTTWELDPVHTLVEFSAKHMMITTVKGRFTDISGTILADEADRSRSSVKATIKAASIDTRTEQRDNHLRSADFLDVEHYPDITFTSTRVEAADQKHLRVIGDLTIHGVTKPVTLDTIFEGRMKDPWGGERAGFTAKARIDRREFGLTWNQALEAGGILVSNEIDISINAQAVKK
ncbi:MAG TPA: YceI family protein [Gemmatimonadaceae bacterium]|nr:YceI family protein [Gemmatimonadaceae bacterium]